MMIARRLHAWWPSRYPARTGNQPRFTDQISRVRWPGSSLRSRANSTHRPGWAAACPQMVAVGVMGQDAVRAASQQGEEFELLGVSRIRAPAQHTAAIEVDGQIVTLDATASASLGSKTRRSATRIRARSSSGLKGLVT